MLRKVYEERIKSLLSPKEQAAMEKALEIADKEEAHGRVFGRCSRTEPLRYINHDTRAIPSSRSPPEKNIDKP